MTERHRDRETQRHRDTETQRHRDTETQRHKATERQRKRKERDRMLVHQSQTVHKIATERNPDKEANIQTKKHTKKEINRQIDSES